MFSESETIEQKKSLRRELRAKIAVIPEKEFTEKSKIITTRLAAEIAKFPGKIIGTYQAVSGEPDISTLFALKLRFCLPALIEKNSPLVFREYHPGDSLEPSHLYNHIMQPGVENPEIIPDIIIIPLLGFDTTGTRLGRGAGYYDRTLEFLRKKKKILCLGVGFEIQKILEIPTLPHDRKMDLIVTENRIYRF